MSLTSPMQDLPSQDYSGISFIGKVVSNADPLYKERIKVTIDNIFDIPPYTIETLPWVIPKACHSSVGVAFGEFDVPDVGSYVWVEFQQGKINYPVYLGAAVMHRNVAEALVNYPHRKGFKDRKGNLFYIDKHTNDVHFQHVSGTTIHIIPDGSVTVSSVGTVDVNSPTKITFTAPEVVVAASTKMTVTSPLLDASTDIVAGSHVKDQGGTKTMAGMRSVYNSHTHNDPQGDTTGVPLQGA